MLMNCFIGNIKSVAHILHEFFLEIRYRWETGFAIPGLPQGPPDQAYCLLHQKLQMINYCIQRKKESEMEKERKANEESEEEDNQESDQVEEDEDDEDEFFDCDEDPEETKKKKQKSLPVWNSKPEGRSKKLGKIKLLEHDDWLYVPKCQDPAPMTEDQVIDIKY